MTAPVSCCLIVKDDASTIEVCLKSIRPHVSEIIIVDTGSQDGTLEIAEKYADKIEQYTECNNADGLIDSFSNARNRSFSHATQPWVLWFDGDDEVFGLENLPKIIESHSDEASRAPVSIMFPYEYAYDENGNPTLVHYRERLISNKDDFEWVGDVHEVLVPKHGAFSPRSDLVKVAHRRHLSIKKTEPGRNLRILRRMYERNDRDARLLYYLGMECKNNGLHEESIGHLTRHIELSGWPDEQYMSCLLIVDIHKSRLQYDRAIEWCQRAILIREDWGEAYFEMSKCFYFLAQSGKDTRRNWERCAHFAQVGLSFSPTNTPLFINPLERQFEIHRYLNVALNFIGQTSSALESVEKALSVKADSALESNKKLYEQFLFTKSVSNELDNLVRCGKISQSIHSSIMSTINGDLVETKNSTSSGHLINERQSVGDYPEHYSRGMQLAMFQGLWKTLLLHDEIFAARNLMCAVPWAIRDLPEVSEMHAKTNFILSVHDDPEIFADHYSNSNSGACEVETIPLPGPVWKGHSHYPRWTWLLEAVGELSKTLARPLDVLDVGSADGWLTNRIAQLGHKAWGVDTRINSVNLSNAKAGEFSTGAVHAVHDFLDETPIPVEFPKTYDVIVLYEVYEHLHDPVHAMRRAREILNPGGLLLISTPRGSWGQGVIRPGHYLWNDESFREHIRAAIPDDLNRDYNEAGFSNFSFKVVEHTDGYIPGQASLLTRGESSPTIEHVRSPLDIALFVGWNTESWNPETVEKTGMGGSETAAMEMSRLLTARGNRVRLYGDCAGIEGTFSGVEYIHYSKFKDLSCDVLMISRRPSAVDAPGIERKATLCWVHDIHCGPDLTHERALKIDKFLTLSNWHKDFFFSQYDFLHPSQVSVTRNGINLSRFNLAIPRNPHRAVYSSSPDRGMEVAVRSWNLVRKRIPDAELHIYYGFQTWEACIGNDQNQRDTVQRLKKLLAENAENGVFYHGRVDQKTLAREYLASGVWAYPSGFSETSCISAMEAHAAGLRMITSPIAALNETVGNRGVMIYGDWLSEDYGRKFVDAVVLAMTNPDLGDRNVLQTYARENFSWEGVASDWDQMLRKTIDLVSENKVVQYRGSR